MKLTPHQHTAVGLLDHGFSVLPTNADKTPACSWKKYQSTRMSVDDVPKLFTAGRQLAIVAGAVSGYLECLDIDDPTLFEPFLAALEDHSSGLPAKLCQRKSPNGYHILYRCEEPVAGNQKLAVSADKKVKIETRGEGGYFLHTPSEGYEVITNSLKNCPVLSADEVRSIHLVAGMFDKRISSEERSRHGQHNDGIRPGDVFNKEHRAGNLLENYGWKPARRTTGGMGYTRPGKKEGVSGVVMDQTGSFYCWSSNGHPLEPGESYSPFAIFATFEHGGDFQAAARDISRKNANSDSSRQHLTARDSISTAFDYREQHHDSNLTAGRQQTGSLSHIVRQYIEDGSGKFTTNDVTSYSSATTRADKSAVYCALRRMKKAGKIKKIETEMSTWEVVEAEPEDMNIEGDSGEPANIPLPLNISDMANIYPGSIILIAGSSNAGKTAFLLSILDKVLSGGTPLVSFKKDRKDTAHKNESITVHPKNIRYLNCEMSAGELRARLSSFATRPIKEWTEQVSFIERSRLFHQMVLPDGLTFIDYLDITEDFFEAPHLISQIHEQLDTGIAIVAMQKPPDRKFAIGGAQTIAKPRLVINLDSNDPYGMIAQLVKVKEPVDFRSKPQGKEIDFQITPSCKFQPLSGWRFVNQQQRKTINVQYQRELDQAPARVEVEI